jgi:hypothetical protein
VKKGSKSVGLKKIDATTDDEKTRSYSKMIESENVLWTSSEQKETECTNFV